MASLLRLPINPSDEELLAAVESWIDDLARQDYDSAFARTEHDAYFQWSPALIRSVIEGYGLPEPHPNGVYRVAARTDALGAPLTREVERVHVSRPGSFAEVLYDLPLNGEWSDLTATFGVQARPGHAVLVLWEIHVF